MNVDSYNMDNIHKYISTNIHENKKQSNKIKNLLSDQSLAETSQKSSRKKSQLPCQPTTSTSGATQPTCNQAAVLSEAMTSLKTSYQRAFNRIVTPLNDFCSVPLFQDASHPSCSWATQNPEQRICEATSEEAAVEKQLNSKKSEVVSLTKKLKYLLFSRDAARHRTCDSCSRKHRSQISSRLKQDCSKCIRAKTMMLKSMTQVFDDVIRVATEWLRLDYKYTKWIKSQLCSIHRRCLSADQALKKATSVREKIANEQDVARDKHEKSLCRADKMEKSRCKLEHEILRAKRQLLSVSEKLKLKEDVQSSATDSLLKKQEGLRKKIEILKTKHSEVKESCTLLKAYCSTSRESRDKLLKKLSLSESEVSRAQQKVDHFRQLRAAHHRKYQIKTNPELLRKRFEDSSLKSFRLNPNENDFLEMQSIERLSKTIELAKTTVVASQWKQLCRQLPWSASVTACYGSVGTGRSDVDSGCSSGGSSSKGFYPQDGAIWTHVAEAVGEMVPDRGSLGDRKRLELMLEMWCQHEGGGPSTSKFEPPSASQLFAALKKAACDGGFLRGGEMLDLNLIRV